MEYNEFFWKHIDTLCSDTSLAHSFGEKVWNHQQQEVDRLKAIIAEALAAYDRPMCDETALYQRDDDIWHILTEHKFV